MGSLYQVATAVHERSVGINTLVTGRKTAHRVVGGKRGGSPRGLVGCAREDTIVAVAGARCISAAGVSAGGVGVGGIGAAGVGTGGISAGLLRDGAVGRGRALAGTGIGLRGHTCRSATWCSELQLQCHAQGDDILPHRAKLTSWDAQQEMSQLDMAPASDIPGISPGSPGYD